MQTTRVRKDGVKGAATSTPVLANNAMFAF